MRKTQPDRNSPIYCILRRELHRSEQGLATLLLHYSSPKTSHSGCFTPFNLRLKCFAVLVPGGHRFGRDEVVPAVAHAPVAPQVGVACVLSLVQAQLRLRLLR